MKNKEFKVVEKKNHLAVHALFGQNKPAALQYLAETIPEYVKKGYYANKTLKPEDFEIVFN